MSCRVWFLVGVVAGALVLVIGGFATVSAIAGIVDRMEAERDG